MATLMAMGQNLRVVKISGRTDDGTVNPHFSVNGYRAWMAHMTDGIYRCADHRTMGYFTPCR